MDLPLIQLDQSQRQQQTEDALDKLLAAYRQAVVNNVLYPDAFHVSREREQKARQQLVDHYAVRP